MRFFLFLILIVIYSFATVVDVGSSISSDNLINEQCNSYYTTAVYTCTNSAIKVAKTDGTYSFFLSSGKSIDCPSLNSAQISAECRQYLSPNLCSTNNQCPSKIINETINEIPKNETVEQPINNTQPIIETKSPPPPLPPVIKTPVDHSFDFLALGAVIIGAITLIVLFMLFKRSVSD